MEKRKLCILAGAEFRGGEKEMICGMYFCVVIIKVACSHKKPRRKNRSRKKGFERMDEMRRL